jgi:hypothetical protein
MKSSASTQLLPFNRDIQKVTTLMPRAADLPCGKILLPIAAIFILHIVRSLVGPFAPVEKVSQFQKVIHTKR